MKISNTILKAIFFTLLFTLGLHFVIMSIAVVLAFIFKASQAENIHLIPMLLLGAAGGCIIVTSIKVLGETYWRIISSIIMIVIGLMFSVPVIAVLAYAKSNIQIDMIISFSFISIMLIIFGILLFIKHRKYKNKI